MSFWDAVGDFAGSAVDGDLEGMADAGGDAVGEATDWVTDAADDAGEMVEDATGGAIGWDVDVDDDGTDVSLGGGILGTHGQTSLHVDADASDGDFGVVADTHADFGDQSTLGMRHRIGNEEMPEGQYGVDGLVYNEDGALGVTVHADVDDNQTGLDAGVFHETVLDDGEVRGEVGLTANFDNEPGRQVGFDAGVYAELSGRGADSGEQVRTEMGVTANYDEQTVRAGEQQLGLDVGVFHELDAPEGTTEDGRSETGATIGGGASQFGAGVEAGFYGENTIGDQEIRIDGGAFVGGIAGPDDTAGAIVGVSADVWKDDGDTVEHFRVEEGVGILDLEADDEGVLGVGEDGVVIGIGTAGGTADEDVVIGSGGIRIDVDDDALIVGVEADHSSHDPEAVGVYVGRGPDGSADAGTWTLDGDGERVFQSAREDESEPVDDAPSDTVGADEPASERPSWTLPAADLTSRSDAGQVSSAEVARELGVDPDSIDRETMGRAPDDDMDAQVPVAAALTARAATDVANQSADPKVAGPASGPRAASADPAREAATPVQPRISGVRSARREP